MMNSDWYWQKKIRAQEKMNMLAENQGVGIACETQGRSKVDETLGSLDRLRDQIGRLRALRTELLGDACQDVTSVPVKPQQYRGNTVAGMVNGLPELLDEFARNIACDIDSIRRALLA